jgi:hypothetical protein
VLNLKMFYSNALVLPPYPPEDAAKEIFLLLWPRSAETGRPNKNPEGDPVTSRMK